MTSKKVWFVTGCSKGLGHALVKKLLEEGYPVAAATITMTITTAITTQGQRACFFFRVFLVCVFIAFCPAGKPPRFLPFPPKTSCRL